MGRMERALPFLGVHGFDRVGKVKGRDLFDILELEEFIAAVPSHVDEDVGVLVGVETFACRGVMRHTVCNVSLVSTVRGKEEGRTALPVSRRMKFSTVTSSPR